MLDLDASGRSIVAELPPWADDVTLAQMMHHISGISEHIVLLFDAGFDFTELTTQADAIRVLSSRTEGAADFGEGALYGAGIAIEQGPGGPET